MVFLISVSVITGVWGQTVTEQNSLLVDLNSIQVAKAQASVPAFPGCEGFGCETPGGRGGIVVPVTNLNDSGPGSLREALYMTEPRIIVFKVSGTIYLKSFIDLGEAHSYVTVAGQTAPGDGIAIADYYLRFGRNKASGAFHDGVFQYLRFRPGYGGDISATHSIVLLTGTNHVVFDHNSFTWGSDEVISIAKGKVSDITWQWNIFAEGGQENTGGHNAGSLFGGGHHERIMLHHNYLAHTSWRNYHVVSGAYDFINNVNYNTFNWDFSIKQGGAGQDTDSPPIAPDIINHYFKEGPNSRRKFPFSLIAKSHKGGPLSIYLAGNKYVDIKEKPVTFSPNEKYPNDVQWSMARPRTVSGEVAPTYKKRFEPHSIIPQFPVTQQSAEEGKDLVLANAGPRLPKLDAVDIRLLGDFSDGGGYDNDNIGKYPKLETRNVLTDTDNDGLPDDWEIDNGLNPNVKDNNGHDLHPVYDNVEIWIASLSNAEVPPPGNQANCTKTVAQSGAADSRTIQAAADSARAGDVICVKAGVYNEQVNISKSNITLAGESGAIIDASQAVPKGIWRKVDNHWETTQLSGTPDSMIVLDPQEKDSGKQWKQIGVILRKLLQGSSLSRGDGFDNLNKSENATMSLEFTGATVKYWDGIEAMFGYADGTSYIRFRDPADSPDNYDLRYSTKPPSARESAVVRINNKNNIVVRGFTIQGARNGVIIEGSGAKDNIIENNLIMHGHNRVLIKDSASNNHIRNNEITMNYYGFDELGPHGSNPLNEHIYRQFKYVYGNSGSDDRGVLLDEVGDNNKISGNHIYHGLIGISSLGDAGQPNKNLRVYGNTVHGHASLGIVNIEYTFDAEYYDNLIYNNNINMRWHRLNVDDKRRVYVYRNRFWQPSGADGYHIYAHWSGGSGSSAKGTQCKQCSFLGGRLGLIADRNAPPYVGDGSYSLFAENSLATNLTGVAFNITGDIADWQLDIVNSFNNGTNFSPASSPNLINVQQTDPGLGSCQVFIPESSPMKRAGKGGADIGANVLYQYVNGVLTNKPLWDVSVDNGRFTGCGAIVPGINDIPGQSCFDVHKRLNVNISGCSLPY